MDYPPALNAVIERAYQNKQNSARWKEKGIWYYVNFQDMKETKQGTSEEKKVERREKGRTLVM